MMTFQSYRNKPPETRLSPTGSADLPAAYAFGIARHHGFSDGNRRTAWVVARLFLADKRRSRPVTFSLMATIPSILCGPTLGLRMTAK